MIQELVLFILTFLIVFIGYKIFIISKTKSKKAKKNKKVYEPIEVTYLVNVYKIDLKDINYSKLLNIVTLTTSFDVSFVVSIISNIHNFYLEIFGAIVLLIFMILVSYHLVYLFYKRGGMKND